MRACFAFVVPVAFGLCCTNALAQTAPPHVVETIAHIGDVSVPLRITTIPPRRSVYNDGKSGGLFAPLAAAARAGDDRAAVYLYEETMQCRFVPTTPTQLQARLDKLKNDYAVTGGHGRTLEQEIAEVETWYRRCEGTTKSDYDEATEILRAAADHGTDPLVMSYYATYASPDDARERLEALWNEGEMSALSGLGHYSLAHRIAYNAAMLALLEHAVGPGDLALRPERLRNETSPSEYNEAAKKAVELLRNPKCCISRFNELSISEQWISER